MTNERKENVYVQPDCEVYQVKLQQMIATSATSASSSNEEYEEASTSEWF